MTFELLTMTKCRALDVRVLAKKDRKPGDLPGMQMLLRADLPAAVLAMFDGFLPGVLLRKATTQGALDGMESYELTNIGEHVKRMAWDYAQTGCTVTIDQGLGASSNLNLADCKMHSVLITPKPGSVQVQWCIDAPALSTETRGKLTDLKATELELTLAGPEVSDDAQAGWPFPKGGASDREAPPQSVTTEKPAAKAKRGAAAAH